MTSVSRAELLNELKQLEQLQGQIADIATRTDEERLRDLIQLRRRLSEQMARVGELSERFFRDGHDTNRAAELRTHFSNMRAKTAAHQANWPAFKLEEASDDYRQSARAVNEAIQGFVAWLRSALG
jgi:CRP-like cAMP-binding protein